MPNDIELNAVLTDDTLNTSTSDSIPVNGDIVLDDSLNASVDNENTLNSDLSSEESFNSIFDSTLPLNAVLEFSGTIPSSGGGAPRQILFVNTLPTGDNINDNAIYFVLSNNVVPDFSVYAAGTYEENGQSYNRVAVTKSKTIDGMYHLIVFYTEGHETYGTTQTTLKATPLHYIAFDYLVGGANMWTRYRDENGNTSWYDSEWTTRLEVSEDTVSPIYDNMLYGTLYFSYFGAIANIHWRPEYNIIGIQGNLVGTGPSYKYATYYYFNKAWHNLGDSDLLAFVQNSLKDKLTNADIVDDLTSTATNKVLSAKQGKELKTLVDQKIIMPSGGQVGNVLKKTSSGTEWGEESSITYVEVT